MVQIAIGANGCVPWCKWRSPLATIGSLIMEPMESLDGDAPFTITSQSEWNSNGTNYARGDNEANGDSMVKMPTVAPMPTVVL